MLARADFGEPKLQRANSTPGRRARREKQRSEDRKSTRLNSSHSQISYAVFCLKKKKAGPHTRRVSVLSDDTRITPAAASAYPSAAHPGTTPRIPRGTSWCSPRRHSSLRRDRLV